ncbi:hypothetical protein QE152_g5922 [Popillia japonica]|uniref:Uncharacterized protein n=1 Tax=Popillia japonica TaxID=7064 RepID=A0AAW1MKU9_POPJA
MDESHTADSLLRLESARLQNVMDESHTADSLLRLDSAHLCNSLLHRIRLIQGRTNLNFNEPHFIESKDSSVRQTKDIIQSIKEGLKKGCSELIQSYESNNRFHSETNASLTEKLNKKNNKVKRQIQKSSSDKIESKQFRNKKGDIHEVAQFCEGNTGKQPEIASGIKLSQIFLNNAETQGELQQVSSTISNKGNKKKKKRKHKGENDSNSSLTQSRSKCDLKKASQQGDATSPKLKSRKTKSKRNKRRIECSGDESDVEEDVSNFKMGEEGSNPNLQNEDKPRRKLRNKQRPKSPTLAAMRRHDRPLIPDFKDMVSSTIARLNTVNESVQKVIEDSLSSSSSLTKKCSFPTIKSSGNTPYVQPTLMAQNLNPKDASVSSISWSTVTITNANENSEISAVTRTEKSPPKKAATSRKSSDSKSKPQTPEIPQPPAACAEQIPPKKKAKSPHSENKIKKSDEKVTSSNVEKEVAPKKKKEAKKKEESAEPVSSLKKTGKKKKSKNVVNFNTVPEVVPNYTPEPTTVTLPPKSAKSVRAALNESLIVTQAKPKTATKSSREDSGKIGQTKSKHDNRRISSARAHRNVQSREDSGKIGQTKSKHDNRRISSARAAALERTGTSTKKWCPKLKAPGTYRQRNRVKCLSALGRCCKRTPRI